MNLLQYALSTYSSMTGNRGRQKTGKSIAYFAVIILILWCSVLFAGCTSTDTTAKQVVKPNDTVRVYYTLWVNGTIFETSPLDKPLNVTIGQGKILKALESGIVGMAVGENKTITIPAAQAYGLYNQSLIGVLNYTDVQNGLQTLNGEGNLVKMTLPDGQVVYIYRGTNNTTRYLRFMNVSDTQVRVDENMPLAGKDLTFDIKLIEIVKSS